MFGMFKLSEIFSILDTALLLRENNGETLWQRQWRDGTIIFSMKLYYNPN